MTDVEVGGSRSSGVLDLHELQTVETWTTPERLAANTDNYPELRRSLSDADLQRAQTIGKALLALPFVHATKGSFDSYKELGVLPHVKARRASDGHTNTLDAELGLNGCSFVSLAEVQPSLYGKRQVILSSELASNENVFVTPYDVVRGISQFSNVPWRSLDAEIKQHIHDQYVNKALTGKDWLDVVARRLLVWLHRAQNAAEGELPLPVIYPSRFGEWKHLGVIEASLIVRFVDGKDESAYHRIWSEIIAQGFMPLPVAQDMKRRGGHSNPPPYITKEAIKSGRNFWFELSGMA